MRPGTTHRLIAVYHKDTGAIRQIVECNARDAARQHEVFDGHASLDITDHPGVGLKQPPQARCHPKRHAVDPKTLAVIPKVATLDEVRAATLRAVRQRCEQQIRLSVADPGDFYTAKHAAHDKLAALEQQIAAAPDIATLGGISW